MKQVIIYATPTCPYCLWAKRLLASKGLEYTEIDVSRDPKMREEMNKLSEQRTVPQIVIDGQHIGGYTNLVTHFSNSV